MKTLKRYLITLGVESALVLIFCVLNDLFSQTDPVIIFKTLINVFFGVGFVTAGFGVLVYTSNEGVFDGLTFAVGSFINIFRKRHVRSGSYYDYKERRAQRKMMGFGHIILCGLLFVAIGLLMYLPYNSVK
jgi:uncharacterized membrane protein YphA (DoxX/SURF4 family)